MKYSNGFKGSVVKQVLGGGKSSYQVSKETGVNVVTVRSWLKRSKEGSLALDGSDGELAPGNRSPGEKLSLLIQSSGLADAELGEWLRTNGLHSEHLSLWEQELITMANDKQTILNAENVALKKENRELQKELVRKEKALAETAVLLTLKKKFQHLFQEDGEN